MLKLLRVYVCIWTKQHVNTTFRLLRIMIWTESDETTRSAGKRHAHSRRRGHKKGIVGSTGRQREACLFVLFAFLYTLWVYVCVRVWQYTFSQVCACVCVCEVACRHALCCVFLIALWEWWWRAGWGCWLPAPRRWENTQWRRRCFPEPATPRQDCSTHREPCWGGQRDEEVTRGRTETNLRGEGRVEERV